MPDIVQMDYKYIQQYVNNDLLMDLTPYIRSGTIGVSNCNRDVLNSGRAGDGLYAICNDVNVPALLYNKAALDEAGITVKDDMTIDEFITSCKKVREKTGYKANITYDNGESFIKYFLRAGDVVMFEDGKLSGTANDYVFYLKFYEDGTKDGWTVDPSIPTEKVVGSVEQDPMVYGFNPETMSWYALSYANQFIAIRNVIPKGVEIAITAWSSADPARSDYLKSGQLFVTTKNGADPDEAAKVLDFITNSVEYNKVLLGERGIPLSSPVADSITPKMDETSQEVVKFINDVVPDNPSQLSPPAADGSSEINDLPSKLEEQVYCGQMAVEDAGQQLSTEGSKIMESEKNQ